MGSGIRTARLAGSTVHADAIENMRDQLLIVLINRLGGEIRIPVKEIDDTGGFVMMMRALPESREFEFVVRRKS